MPIDELFKILMKPNIKCVMFDNIYNLKILSICSTYEEYTQPQYGVIQSLKKRYFKYWSKNIKKYIKKTIFFKREQNLNIKLLHARIVTYTTYLKCTYSKNIIQHNY